jgi:HlyD family secretion protein
MEIVEGLQEGDKIVEGPYRTLSKDLKEGDRVEEMKAKGKGGFSRSRS